MFFASDNSGPAPQQIIDALIAENQGYAMAYGNDTTMQSVVEAIRTAFEAPDAAVYLVATGTAANALSIATLTRPWQTVFCHEHAHVQEDECGAPEFYSGGVKLTTVGGADGKIEPGLLTDEIRKTGCLGVHGVQIGTLSITNVTERGSVYSPEELRTLTGVARDHGMRCHLDGARLANALVAIGCTPAEATWKSGIDVVSLGGTKNGLIGVEGVVLFDPELAWEFELRRKRGGHLFSKHRFLSAQMKAYFENGLWLELAGRANAAASRLADGLSTIVSAHFVHPAEANMIFAGWSHSGHKRAQAAGAQYYLWPPHQDMSDRANEVLTARLVCNWATTDDEIDRFLELIDERNA